MTSAAQFPVPDHLISRAVTIIGGEHQNNTFQTMEIASPKAHQFAPVVQHDSDAKFILIRSNDDHWIVHVGSR